jgi:hypothetical protein
MASAPAVTIILVVMKISVTMEMFMSVNMDIKIRQHEKPRKPETRPPERVRDPSVQICVGRRRGIISDYGGAFLIVVIVYNGSVRLGAWHISCGLFCKSGLDRHVILRQYILKGLERLSFAHAQVFRLNSVHDRLLEFPDDIGRNRIIGNPAVLRSYADSAQFAFSLRLIRSRSQFQGFHQP